MTNYLRKNYIKFDIKNDNFLFICNENDFSKNKLKELFDNLKISYEIISIQNHKLGPVYSLIQAKNYIKDLENVIVNYCDFYWNWDYNNFKTK